ncbi:transglycosylase SLT domain-containing protein [candidate division KSB3 bacterium]|uniref:Transglycosylase SLT domain-containing protein n=1 Tax=candidate division KSB3 bacterium TaxID=2044937 RepID=A0A9D5JRY8_9BACT|nr:transglycosylase SLT domain-containing protein [candidate division KSB3 bacterium]MBD3323162.1 transglycosylase SLT domain-containing protein [candidate division KSB3 bacterium]
MKTYTVQPGDSLFAIAEKFYGDGYKYKQLALYNNLDNPNALEVGQRLSIPDLAELQQPLRAWHNYNDGSIYWRVTPQGIEIQGQGLVKDAKYSKQAAEIWSQYQEPILSASKKHGVPVPVIIATISTESSGNAKAYRYEPLFYRRYIKNKPQWKENPYYDAPRRISASYGLMQIMYPTAYNVGFRGEPEGLYDPLINIQAGAAYIASAYQVKHHGWDPPKIACAYNAGSVRPTETNDWGMFHHPGHLDRWIPSYNGAIDVTQAAVPEENLTPPVEGEPPQPAEPPEPPEPQQPPSSVVTLQFLLPNAYAGSGKALIADMFRHDENGLGDPTSFRIESATPAQGGGYAYELPDIPSGVYDLVFTDAATNSVVHDLAEVELEDNPTVIDIRSGSVADATISEPPQEAPPTQATLRIQFAKVPGKSWKSMIIDLFRHHAGGGVGAPASYTVKMPSYGPGGEYIYDIPNLKSGVYDLVFTDAATKSVVDDVADVEVNKPLVVVDLAARSRQAAPSADQPRSAPQTRSFGIWLKELWHRIWG